jgi:hypothetical protein
MVLDPALAYAQWNWSPQTALPAVLEEIAAHAHQNPDWLDISGG